MSELVLRTPVVAILRGIDPGFFAELLPELFAAGLDAVEVTMNTAGALKMIESHAPWLPVGKILGMGTVRDLEEAKRAVSAGAMFLVTPNCDCQVIAFARMENIPIIAGSLTPTEVYEAWQAGATMVKVFPCNSMGGPEYIRELRGPFDHIPLVAVGGVCAENVAAYLKAGCTGVGVGGSVFGKEALEQKDVAMAAGNLKKFLAYCLPGQDTV